MKKLDLVCIESNDTNVSVSDDRTATNTSTTPKIGWEEIQAGIFIIAASFILCCFVLVLKNSGGVRKNSSPLLGHHAQTSTTLKRSEKKLLGEVSDLLLWEGWGVDGQIINTTTITTESENEIVIRSLQIDILPQLVNQPQGVEHHTRMRSDLLNKIISINKNLNCCCKVFVGLEEQGSVDSSREVCSSLEEGEKTSTTLREAFRVLERHRFHVGGKFSRSRPHSHFWKTFFKNNVVLEFIITPSFEKQRVGVKISMVLSVSHYKTDEKALLSFLNQKKRGEIKLSLDECIFLKKE